MIDIYLSGPIMSFGKEEDNVSKFQEWARKLRGMGYTVFSPPEDEPEGLEWADYLRRDIVYLTQCEKIAVLPGWDRSRGATLEVDLATRLGMEVVPVSVIKPKQEDVTDNDVRVAHNVFETGKVTADEANLAFDALRKNRKIDEADTFIHGGFEERVQNREDLLTDRPPQESTLEEAIRLVTKDRGNQYGPPEQDFERTAELWSGLFKDLLEEGVRFKPEHVALAMIALKMSRAMWSEKRDNWVDIEGYAACGHRCVTKEW